MNLKKLFPRFTPFELALWGGSALLIVISFFIFDRSGYMTLVASLVGVTSLIFCAKGNPIGQALMIVFCIIYAIIAMSFAYYGELMTYIGMSLPMAVFALISWLKNPSGDERPEVKINRIHRREVFFMLALAVAVTLGFYFILKIFNTSNLLPSTVSVTTSFTAAYLCLRRSPYFALAYALNDIVLIVLWLLASMSDISYISVVICFAAFLANDLYGFINWKRMLKRQEKNTGF